MGTETAKKKGFVEGLKREFEGAFSVKPPFALAMKAAGAEETEALPRQAIAMESVDVPFELKALESEHHVKIDMLSRNLQSLRESQVKLKSALDILRELNLSIPAEITSRLDCYPLEIGKLEAELEREKTLLGYLQTRVLPLIQKT